MGASDFEFFVQIQLPDAVLTVVGELDVLRVGDVAAAIDEVLDQGARNVRIDLGSVSFVDAAGIAMLVGIATAVRDRGGDAEVVRASDAVRRLATLVGADDVLGLEPLARPATLRPPRQRSAPPRTAELGSPLAPRPGAVRPEGDR